MLPHFRALSVPVLSAILGCAAIPASAEVLYSGGEIQLHYGDGFHFGANGFDATKRTTVTLEHFTLFNWGDLFYFVDLNQDHEGDGPRSSHYAELWGHLGGKTLGFDFAENGLVKDVGPDLGLNYGQDFLTVVPGVRADLNVPGFSLFTLGAYAYHNVEDPFDRDLDTTYQVTLVWDAPFKLGSERFDFKGFVDFIGDQGSGVDNQVVFSPQLRWDVGAEGGALLGLEYTYFKNKFGVTGKDDNSLSVFAALKF